MPLLTRATSSVRLAVASSVIAAAVAAITACSGGEPAGTAAFTAYDFALTDPAGDTLVHADTAPHASLDVTGISGSVNALSLVVRLTFTRPVAPWTAQTAGSVDGFVDLDVDENSATGIPGAASEYGGSAPLGSDYYVDLRDVSAGHVALRRVTSGTSSPEWAVAATWSGSTMEITIPRSLLSDPDGQFRLSAVVGNADIPATDFAPSDGYYRVAR